MAVPAKAPDRRQGPGMRGTSWKDMAKGKV